MFSHMTSTNLCQWLHVLLRGEAGESEQGHDEYVQEFGEKSLDAIHLPILEFRYTNPVELRNLINAIAQNHNEASGLIVTSPRVVEAIRRSLNQHELSKLSTGLNPNLVFAVGPKTADECEKKLNLKCNGQSLTSSDSAHLARIIKSTCETTDRSIRLVYPKSSLADKTIENALADTEHVSIEVVVGYETKSVDDLQIRLLNAISCHLARNNLRHSDLMYINLIFFSPSGVEGYLSKLDQRQLIESLTERIGKIEGIRKLS